MSQSAEPGVVAVGLEGGFPWCLVFDPVVVTAQWRKIAGGGGPTVGNRYPVVEVTVDRRHPTSGEDATPETR